MLGIAKYVGDQRGVSLKPRIDRDEASRKALTLVSDTAPGLRIRRRVALIGHPRASRQKAALIWKMSIERMPLHTGPFRQHAVGRLGRADRSMQLDRRFDDPPSRLTLLIRASFKGVCP